MGGPGSASERTDSSRASRPELPLWRQCPMSCDQSFTASAATVSVGVNGGTGVRLLRREGGAEPDHLSFDQRKAAADLSVRLKRARQHVCRQSSRRHGTATHGRRHATSARPVQLVGAARLDHRRGQHSQVWTKPSERVSRLDSSPSIAYSSWYPSANTPSFDRYKRFISML